MNEPQQTQALAAPERHSTNVARAMKLNSGLIVQPQNMGELMEYAKMVSSSGMVPKDYAGNPGAVIVAWQLGAELGLSPMAALQNISVVNGRPSVWGDAGLAIVRTHSEFEDISESVSDDGKATCTIKRRGRSPVTQTFSVEDAKRAGLWGKAGPWTNYTRRMLQMRARWFAMRDAFPDALRGISSAEEGSDIATSESPSIQRVSVAVVPASEVKQLETQYDDASADVVRVFEAIGVSREMLARHLGREPVSLAENEIERLRGVYAEVRQHPKRKAELFGAPSSAANDINAKFGGAA